MFAVSDGNSVELHSWETHELKTVIPYGVSELQITSDSEFVFMITLTNSIQKYSIADNTVVSSREGEFVHLVIPPNDEYLVLVDGRDLVTVLILSVSDLSTQQEFVMDKFCSSVSINRDSEVVYYGDGNSVDGNSILALNIIDGSSIRLDGVYLIEECKLNDRLLCWNDDDSITVTDGNTEITKSAGLIRPKIIYDGSTIVGENLRSLIVLNAETLEEVRRIPIGERFSQILTSPISKDVIIRTGTRVIIVNTVTGTISAVKNSDNLRGIASSGPFLGNILL
jgi:hypothetical protein